MTNNIKLHNQVEFQAMRRAGEIAADCLDFITDFVKPGIRPSFPISLSTCLDRPKSR